MKLKITISRIIEADTDEEVAVKMSDMFAADYSETLESHKARGKYSGIFPYLNTFEIEKIEWLNEDTKC